MDTQELTSALRLYTGTETWHRHGLNRNLFYTDGVEFFAKNAGGGAYWFLDIVATEVFRLLKAEPFLHIVLKVTGDSAVIKADDGNDKQVYKKKIGYTDCPVGSWEFYLTDNVLLLPSEY